MFNGLVLDTNLEDGIYYNREPNSLHDTYFIDTNSNSLKQIYELKDVKLEEKIYYSPSKFPRLHKLISHGTAWKNCYALSCSHDYNVKDKKATVILHQETKIPLIDYCEKYYKLIEQEIIKIYSQHNDVVLQFSGGIDSLVLLSYIVKLGYAKRTTLVNFENYFIEDHPDLIRNNIKKNLARTKLMLDCKNYLSDFIIMELTDEDWLWAVNNCTYTQCQLYGSMKILKNFPNTALITGHHGDQTLLHDTMWINHIFASSKNIQKTLDQYTKNLQNKSLYMNNYLDFDEHGQHYFLQDYTWHLKYWNDLNGYNGCNVYTPLAADTRLCRYIDIDSLTLLDIMDASVAKFIINKNVDQDFNEYITHQGNLDGDVFSKKYFEKSRFSANLFDIPKNINHSMGLSWLEKSLCESMVETNTIISLKMLQYISKNYEDVTSYV